MADEKPKIEWTKYGFTEDSEYKGLYDRGDFPFYLSEHNSFLHVIDHNLEYTFSKDTIVANNQSVVLLLKAFNCPKLP